MELRKIREKLIAEEKRVLARPKVRWGFIYALVVVLVIALFAALYAQFKPAPVITQNGFTQAPEMKKVGDIPKVPVPGPKVIYVYPKNKVAEKVNLPPEVKNNPKAEIISTATAPESKNGYNSITTMEDGKATTYMEEKPSPLFQLRNDLTAGVRGGFVTGGGTPYGGDVHAEWKFLRVKNGKLGAYVEAGVMGATGYGKAMISADFDLN